MVVLTRLSCAASLPAIVAIVGSLLLAPPVRAAEPKPAKPTVAVLVGGADGDLKVLRDTLEKVPGVKFKANELQFADFGRDGGLFTNFFAIDIADLAKTDIGAIARAVAGANTSKKEKCPPSLFVILKYKPDSVKTDELRKMLAKVKGVHAEKSWAGDSNLWVGVDGSGQAKLGEITKALHDAGVKFRDPTDITEKP